MLFDVLYLSSLVSSSSKSFPTFIFIATVDSVDYSQVNDAVHVESNGVHFRQFFEQADLPTAVALG